MLRQLFFSVLQGETVIVSAADGETVQQVPDIFHHPVFAVGGAIKSPVILEDPSHFPQRPGKIRDVVEHHIGDHDVKFFVGKRNVFDIDHAVFYPGMIR